MNAREMEECLNEMKVHLDGIDFGEDARDALVDAVNHYMDKFFEELLKLANHAGRKVPFYF